MTHPVEVVAEIMAGAGPLDVAGDFYLLSTGAIGSNATVPDQTALDIVADIDVRVDATLDSWTAPAGTGYEIFGKFAPPSNQSWLLWTDANRRLVFWWSTTGADFIDAYSTVPLPIASGRLAVRAALDVNNGSGGWTVRLYTAPTIAGPWTQLGAAISEAGVTSIHNSTATLGVGNVPGSGFPSPPGRFHAAQVYADLAATDARANPDFTAQDPGTTSFTDDAGRTWSVNGTASIAGFDWEPIPDDTNGRKRLQSLSWDTGRTDPLSWFPAGTAEATFRSNDRLLDPDYTAGQYSGQLLPQVPLRFRSVTPDADLFYGFPQSGWEQAYDKPYAARSTVRLRDLLGVIDEMPLPRSAYEAEVLTDNPVAFWRLDETAGTQMSDSSGAGRHGRYDNTVLGEDPLIFGDGNAVLFPHVGENRGEWQGEGLPVGAPCTIEAWVKTDRDPLAVKTIVMVQRDSSLGSGLWFQIAPAADGSPNGELVINFFGLGTFYKARGHTRLDDGDVHHVVCTIAGNAPGDVQLYVDGGVETKTTFTVGNPGPWSGHLLWTIGNTTTSGHGEWGFDGTIDEVAVYDYVLSAEQVASHYAAGTTAFDEETSGERIDRVLDLIGVPAALRDIAAGDTTVGPADYGGSTVGSYLNRVVESEQGYLYVDHPAGGKLTFRGRYDRLTAARSTTSQATFTDDPDSADWKYRDEIAADPNSLDQVVNTVEVRWRGGTEVVTDDVSVAAYGPRNRSLTTEASSPVSARSAGAWLTSRWGRPHSRVRSLPLTPGGKQTGLAAVVVGQRISDRVTVRRRPVNVGAPVVNELIVEGIHQELTSDGAWLATYHLSDADTSQVWIWGTSTWGETTAWG